MRGTVMGIALSVAAMTLSAGVALAAVFPDDASPVQPERDPLLLIQPAGVTPGLAEQSRADIGELQRAEFAIFTSESPETLAIDGLAPSMYQGRYFTPAGEARRLCIVERESNGRYDAVSPGGVYRGAYQMSAELGEGATWMMLPEHKQLLGSSAAKAILSELRTTPVHRWPRYWQDAAFSTVHNWEGWESGASHWAGGRWHC